MAEKKAEKKDAAEEYIDTAKEASRFEGSELQKKLNDDREAERRTNFAGTEVDDPELLDLDETVPGGVYRVGDKLFNAHGEEVTKSGKKVKSDEE